MALPRARMVFLPLSSASSVDSPARWTIAYHHEHKLALSDTVTLPAKVLTKVESAWNAFGHAEEGNWKRRVHDIGEKLMDRINHFEYAVKDVELPQGWRYARMVHPKLKRNYTLGQAEEEIPIYYPAKFVKDPQQMLNILQTNLWQFAPSCRSRMRTTLLATPLTIPFGLIPIVPNLPLFYMLWRAFSLKKASVGSGYLASMIEHGKLVPRPSPILDELYDLRQTSMLAHPDQPTPTSELEGRPSDHLLLTSGMISDIARDLHMPSIAENLHRAVKQTSDILARDQRRQEIKSEMKSE